MINRVLTPCCTFLDNVQKKFQQYTNSVSQTASKVFNYALKIIFFIVQAALFYSNHNLFVAGFALGFIFDEQVGAVARKVDVVFKAHKTGLEKFLLFSVVGLTALLMMPPSIILTTAYLAANAGRSSYIYCFDKNRSRGLHHSSDDGDVKSLSSLRASASVPS